MTRELSANTNLSHYRIVSKLGAGGMGEVWLAEDTRLDRKVAIKLLPAEFTQDGDRVRRFMQEAKAASALNHPSIITVYDIGESEAGRFIVMELVAGRTLRSVIGADNSLETLLALGSQMARALSAAHAAGITHRDIKPDNIMVREDGYVKVLDFGLARLLPTASGEDAATLAQQTTPGMIMGTVAYMSPEQACGQSASPPSDIFALGIVLYELVTGQHPFRAETLVGYLHAITLQTPPPPSQLRPEILAALDELILRMLKKDATQRPVASEVAQALQEMERQRDTPKPRGDNSETVLLPAGDADTSSDEGFRVAVLPFKSRGANADLAALAEGLTEDVVTGLSRFSYLRVIARSSTLSYASDSGDVRAIGKEVGARYVMEGSLRQAGSMLRVAVQLVDATTGAHLWAETYDRSYSAEQIFALQDDLVPRIVSTVADAYGILPHSMSQAVRSKATDQLTPYESLLRSFSYVERVTAEEHAEAKSALERAVQQAPGDSDSWAMLSILQTDEHIHGFSARTGLLEQALQLARRAIDANPLNHRAYQALAWALCYRKEPDACRHAAERTVALNPMDASAMAYVGQTIAYGGGWERGCELLNRAMQLNPHHPGWYRYALFLNAYRQGDYRGALDIALKMNMPGVSLMYVALAAVYGELGELGAAREALRELLALRPDFQVASRTELQKLWDSDLVDRLIDGLRKAGLQISDDPRQAETLLTRDASGERRADEGFWIGVLPFKAVGSSAELETLASGMTEEIVTGLSRFSYLRVIARGSTLKYSNESGDVRAVGKELGARYVMEGSIRQAGSTVRLAVQLVDASTGAHLWAETFDRHFQHDQIFAMQDELVPRIVSTCADHFGVLARSISDAVRWKDSGQLSPYEALMRGFGYHHRLSPSEHGEAREVLERAVEQAPGNADCWAMLSWIYSHEHGHGFNTQPDSLDRALAAARRAVDLAPSNHLAYQALAVALFFRKDKSGCLSAAERAMALNPLDASNEAIFLITFTGDWERGCALIARAMELNPHHPGWYQWVLAVNEYRKANYREAVDLAVKANVPGIFWTNMLLAAAYGQLGELEAARDALRNLLAQKEDFVEWAQGALGKWFEAELVEHLLDGLRKAGLEVDASLANSGGVRADEGFWVAVMPFKSTGANAGVTALAEGLTEDIITGLSRFSYLRVIARSSTLRYTSESGDMRDVGKSLGARYVMEGSLRQAGSVLRIAVQLVDASTGAHLWAETYNRTFSPEAVFELQDDLVPRIVSTVADWYGVLPHSMSEAVRLKPSDQLSPYEAVLRSFGYYERITPEEHAPVRAGLERAVEQSPGNADGWAMLSMIYGEEHRFGFNAQPDPLGRSLQAARRAVDAAHANHFAWLALAQALFFRKEFDAFRDAAERAIALNPMDGSTVEYLGHLIAFSGDWERGCEVAERARQLNPNHPGWYWAVPFLDAYRKGDYRSARTFLLKGNQQGHFFLQALIAAVQGQLGEREAADKALREALTLKPDFPLTARDDFGKWYLPELVEQLIDGLRKAGLEIAAEEQLADVSTALYASGEKRADEGFWVAVLSFKYSGVNADLTALAEGLSEDIVTGLSRFSYLRVIARSSTLRYSSESSDVRAIGKEIGARYVMEGSLRQAGTKLRLAVQLIDATTGAHLWAENYERSFSPEAVFELQDELVPRIVSTVADQYGALVHSMSESLSGRGAGQYTAHEAVLRAFGYLERITPEEHGEVREILEAAVAGAPGHSDCRAMLSLIYWHEYAQGYNVRPDPLGRAHAAARQAVAATPTNHLAHYVLATVLFFQKDFLAFRPAAERALALNRMDASTTAFIGILIAYSGDWEYGLGVTERAMQLNPHHPGWYHLPAFYSCYRRRDYRGALESALQVNMPGYFFMHAALAAVYGQLGEQERAGAALRELHALAPDFGAMARDEFGKWFDAELTEHLIDGLRKAGLEIADEGAAVPLPVTEVTYGSVRHTVGRTPERNELSRKPQDVMSDRLQFVAVTEPDAVPQLSDRLQFVAATEPDAVPQLSDKLQFVAAPEPDAESQKSDKLQFLVATEPDAESQPIDKLKFVEPSPSIAVLPFVNISNDPDNEYFCDGLAEELLNALSKIEALRVAARTSAFSFKGKETDIREIGRRLNVSAVLEGSVRKAGNRLRITAQLVNIADGYHLWSERYDREMKDIFDVQDEITLTVVDALKMKLLGEEKTAVLKHFTDNTEAYQLYLKGRYHANRFTREGFSRAIEYLKKAIEKDPQYALAYAGIADAYYHAATIHMPPGEAFLEVKAASAKALELDDALAEAHTLLALFVAHYDRKPLEAESCFKRGVDLAPNNVLTHQCYGLYLTLMGRFDEGIAELKRAQELDPLSLIIGFLLGWTYYFARQPEKAKEEARKTLEIDESFWMAHWTMALGYEQTGQYGEALVELEKAKALDDSSWIPAVFARVCARLGRREEAQKILDELTEKSKQQWVAPYLVATAYVSLDRRNHAFEWLQKALEDYDEWIDCINIDPALDLLRSDPRFEDLMHRIGLPH